MPRNVAWNTGKGPHTHPADRDLVSCSYFNRELLRLFIVDREAAGDENAFYNVPKSIRAKIRMKHIDEAKLVLAELGGEEFWAYYSKLRRAVQRQLGLGRKSSIRNRLRDRMDKLYRGHEGGTNGVRYTGQSDEHPDSDTRTEEEKRQRDRARAVYWADGSRGLVYRSRPDAYSNVRWRQLLEARFPSEPEVM